MPVSENVDANYDDDPLRPGRKVHQQDHDIINPTVNQLVAAYDAAVVAGYVGTMQDWLLQIGAFTGEAIVYVFDGTDYVLTGGRIFIGATDPRNLGYIMTDGDQWEIPQ